ncbi:MAG: LytTR family DNA-binding domain-containing protein [Cytophagaceae bacterium]|jgi:DNA-binding LytR/AlgR family response regulator|nr:LytTR family DNA-binding domain-containing protein [Cytophagaceae bacterium]
MSPLNIVVIDDEDLAVQLVETYLKQRQEDTNIKTFFSASEASTFLLRNRPDILITDIQMPEMSGLEIISEHVSKKTKVIIISAYPSYAINAYDLDVIDFIVKPAAPERFQKAIDKAISALLTDTKSSTVYLQFKYDYKNIQILQSSILYIEGFKQYIKIHTEGKVYILLARLKNIIDDLDSDLFIKSHKSYIINIQHIEKFNTKSVWIKGQEIPLSKGVSTVLQQKV